MYLAKTNHMVITKKTPFTLVDLLISTSVVALMLALSLPTIWHYFSSSNERDALLELQQAVQMAKSQTLLNRSPVTLCASKSGYSCDGTWRDGWLVFADHNRDGIVDGDEPVFKTGKVPARVMIMASRASFVFLPNGANQLGEFGVCALNVSSKGSALRLTGFGSLRQDSEQPAMCYAS
jgi:type IV fimbrial biogenesis protein FimT